MSEATSGTISDTESGEREPIEDSPSLTRTSSNESLSSSSTSSINTASTTLATSLSSPLPSAPTTAPANAGNLDATSSPSLARSAGANEHPTANDISSRQRSNADLLRVVGGSASGSGSRGRSDSVGMIRAAALSLNKRRGSVDTSSAATQAASAATQNSERFSRSRSGSVAVVLYPLPLKRELLLFSRMRTPFWKYLQYEIGSTDLLDFWLAAEAFVLLTNQTEMETKALELAGHFFDPDSPHCLKFSAPSAQRAQADMLHVLETFQVHRNMFSQLQALAFADLQTIYYPPFVEIQNSEPDFTPKSKQQLKREKSKQKKLQKEGKKQEKERRKRLEKERKQQLRAASGRKSSRANDHLRPSPLSSVPSFQAGYREAEPPLHKAIREKKPLTDLQAILDEGFSINAYNKNDRNRSALHIAAYDDDPELATFLLERNAFVNASDSRGWTPMHEACYRGSLRVLSLLLKHSASVMVQTNSGTMPLHYLMQTGYPREQEELAHQCLVQMLQLGADPNFQTLHGESPLHYACWGVGLPRNVEFLLQNGGNPNVLNQKGNAPLHYAILQNRIPLVKLLVQHGASVALESSIGGSCRELAAQTKSPELIEFIESAYQQEEARTVDAASTKEKEGILSTPRPSAATLKNPMAMATTLSALAAGSRASGHFKGLEEVDLLLEQVDIIFDEESIYGSCRPQRKQKTPRHKSVLTTAFELTDLQQTPPPKPKLPLALCNADLDSLIRADSSVDLDMDLLTDRSDAVSQQHEHEQREHLRDGIDDPILSALEDTHKVTSVSRSSTLSSESGYEDEEERSATRTSHSDQLSATSASSARGESGGGDIRSGATAEAQYNILGVDIDEVMARSHETGDMPAFYRSLLCYLEQHTNTKLLFQQSASAAHLRLLNEHLDTGNLLDSFWELHGLEPNPHLVAAFLKHYFRSLPSAIWSSEHVDHLIAAGDQSTEAVVLALHDAMSQLPPVKFCMLQGLFLLFSMVSRSTSTEMTSRKLASMWGTKLIRMSGVPASKVNAIVTTTIDYYFVIFQNAPSSLQEDKSIVKYRSQLLEKIGQLDNKIRALSNQVKQTNSQLELEGMESFTSSLLHLMDMFSL
mmetsp:Transcript_15629/g.46825  ORF Transcript_15629/g.46825 Transcript_15629/m.46825 type:complete len:1101 (-) Transcript_15629:61-3363(-)